MPRKKDIELKAPPQSIDSERALIAACLIRPEIIPGVMNALQPSDFYKIEHQHIIKALFELKQNSDIVLVWQWLVDHKLNQETGKEYLMSVAASASTSAGWAYYADIIKEKAQRRQVINICAIGAEQAFDDIQYPVEELLSGLKTGIREIQRDAVPDYRTNLQILQAVYKDIERRSESQDYYVGVKSGFYEIDNNLAGFEPKTSTYLAARPSIGKTALAVNIATNIAFEHPDKKLLYFNLESSAEALIRRQIALKSGILLTQIRRGQIAGNQWENLTQTVGRLSDNTSLCILDHTKFCYVENLVAYAESVAMDHDISLIIIDHIQKMTSRQRTQSRHLEVSYVSNAIQNLLKDLNVPGLILCQLRKPELGQAIKKPQLSEIKETGDIEQNADVIWGLHRESKDAVEAELNQLKGRDTGTFLMNLIFDPKTQLFSDPVRDYDRQESWVK